MSEIIAVCNNPLAVNGALALVLVMPFVEWWLGKTKRVKANSVMELTVEPLVKGATVVGFLAVAYIIDMINRKRKERKDGTN